jgi:hypothetical protein
VVVAALFLALAAAAPPSQPRLLFLSGSPAPVGLKFVSFGRAATNGRGSVCFLAGWDGVNRRREGLYLRRGDEVIPIVRTGDPLPGSASARFSFPPDYPDEMTAFSLNDHDEVAFITRQGLFLFHEGEVRAAARVGEELPDTPGERWEEIYACCLNNSGALAFVAATRSARDGDRHEGVFLLSRDAPKIVLFEGDGVPGREEELSGFAAVSLNDAGQIATLARVGEEALAAILLTTGSETRLVAIQEGDAPGGRWTDLGSVALSASGTIAFQGRVAVGDEERTGIYQASDGAITPVALPGQAVAGPGGGTLGEFLARPVVAQDGAIAFVADLAEAGRPQVLVLASEGSRFVLARGGDPGPEGSGGRLLRFSGLNQGSLRGGRLVCGVDMAGGAAGDMVARFSVSQAPETLVRAGDPLPPGSVLVTVDDETAPGETQALLDPRGRVVFTASAGGYGRALFRLGADGPELLTPLGVATPDGRHSRSVVRVAAGPSGELAFLGHEDEEGQDAAVFVTGPGEQDAPRVVAATGQPAPGTTGQVLTQLGLPVVDGQGQVLFSARSGPAGGSAGASESSLLRATGTQLERLASTGDSVMGAGRLLSPTPGDDLSPVVAFADLQVNRQGQALFRSSYQGADGGTATGLFLWSEGAIRPVALPGQKAPLAGAPVYTSFWAPRLSDGGTVTFVATVAGGGQRAHSALFQVRKGETLALAGVGDLAPGADGARFRSLWEPAVEASGNCAFYALMDAATGGTRLGALYRWKKNALAPVLIDSGRPDTDPAAGLRLDEGSAAAPLALQGDGSLLVAARQRGQAGMSGLFLLAAE